MNEVFDALADPSRRKILTLLTKKDLNVSEILKHFDFRQASLSHHLKTLKDAGLVKSQRRGQFVYYTLKKETLQQTIMILMKRYKEED